MRRPASCTATSGSTTRYSIRTEPRILAVLDWELSTLGHPLVDLAYLCMRYHLSAEQFRGLGGLDCGGARGFRARPSAWRTTAGGAAAHRWRRRSGRITWRSTCSAWPGFCKACWRAPSRAMPRAPRRWRRAAARGRWRSRPGRWCSDLRRVVKSRSTEHGFLAQRQGPPPAGAAAALHGRPRLSGGAAASTRRWNKTAAPAIPGRPTTVIEELKRKAKAEDLWNLFLPHSEHGAGLSRISNTRPCAKSWDARISRPKPSIAPPPTRATWKCWPAMRRPSSRSAGSCRCSRAGSARPSP